MPVIERVTADVAWTAAAKPAERVIPVDPAAYILFRKCDLQPPETGMYSMADLDAKLVGLSISERMEAKTHLRAAGLLRSAGPSPPDSGGGHGQGAVPAVRSGVPAAGA